jgi:hypothetical protein
VALGLSILGILDVQDNRTFFPANPPVRTVRTELAEYADFTDFTARCCCVPYTNPTSERFRMDGVLEVEKWLCANGLVKERIRSRHELNATHVLPRVISGTVIRDGGDS